MINILREVTKKVPEINSAALNAVEEYDRSKFFSFEEMPLKVKETTVTPYTFLAHVFGDKQTIPSAHYVLQLASSLDLRPEQNILEIGAGTGYAAMIFAKTAGPKSTVYSTEVRPQFTELARKNVATYGLNNRVHILQAKETLGAPEYAPFDRIITTVSAKNTSQIENVLDQLAVGGVAQIPVVKIGNVKDKSLSKLWKPGQEIDNNDIYIHSPEKGFVRLAGYEFRKISENEISYSVPVKGALGPVLD